MKEAFCINSCQKVINNKHLKWCEQFYGKNNVRYSHILNGNLEEKIKTL